MLAAATLALLALAACSAGVPSSPASSGEAGLPSASTQVVHLGVDLPLSGGESREGLPILNGIRLAVADANASRAARGTTVDIDARDDAVNGVNNPDRGAGNLQSLVADPSVIGVVGPLSSAVARAEIPIGNAAGLLQCSPANTDPDLTKPWAGADPKTYRPTHPDDIAYVRVSSTDDQQGAAGARIAHDDLAARRALVVDDGTTYGRRDRRRVRGGRSRPSAGPSSGARSSELTGHRVVRDRRRCAPTRLTSSSSAAARTPGGAALRQQMAAAGLGSIPFVGGDAINDGSASSSGSFLQLAGDRR